MKVLPQTFQRMQVKGLTVLEKNSCWMSGLISKPEDDVSGVDTVSLVTGCPKDQVPEIIKL